MTTNGVLLAQACEKCGTSSLAQVSDRPGETHCLHCGYYRYDGSTPTAEVPEEEPPAPRSLASRGGRHYTARDSADSLGAAIEAVLRAERPLHRITIFERLKATGRPLHGLDPSATVWAYLSSDGRFRRTGGGFWTLREKPASCSGCGVALYRGRLNKSGLCQVCHSASLGETYGTAAAMDGAGAGRQTCSVCGKALRPRKVGGSRTGMCKVHFKEKVARELREGRGGVR